MPKPLDKNIEAPTEPNGYSDGSLKNPIGNHWAIGGIGMWWPNRKIEEEPLNKQEDAYTEHEWSERGCMQWAAFNELKNSSTRCEAGAARMAIQKDGPVHVGIDSQATVTLCTGITDHHRRRMDAKLRNERGRGG